ncbi:TPA: adenylyl-sulfate kinase [Campylobacter jejuni]|uniref:adenylyl-sulfate kinase n=1 Tax=Campylobacter jejuni TaxID=197 RepID=UPI00069C154F|nr:adenylyl-sulfate kinase [Campylobacter jejuni]RTJ27942.1 adenylyl-sulfate kinase [Campylobacter jejuni]HED8093090.1 adenylyl-sulfate kinase [Campylobacter jejuni]HEF3760826.1 adenylyl-sulfate kinase [Campylobacter jejuni]HEG0441663.1 adenylyl-sulfate kinase [Campylobacter jejuni]HEG7017524.1 adenylyl-sulfate kinase [Campylobacter jejuni]
MSGVLVYITGLSGSGKTTLAKELQKELILQNIYPILLDGDELRACINNANYDIKNRMEMAMFYVKIAKMLYNQGFIVILSTISMFDSIREFNRNSFQNYLEIFLDVSFEIRKKRDSKNFFKNKMENMAGIDQILELPKKSHIVLKDDFDINNAKILIINKILNFV